MIADDDNGDDDTTTRRHDTMAMTRRRDDDDDDAVTMTPNPYAQSHGEWAGDETKVVVLIYLVDEHGPCAHHMIFVNRLPRIASPATAPPPAPPAPEGSRRV
jgi:hypothetical protein